jgi:succinate dehydrogenase / fumarate reductase cytochrome b subunit
MTIETTSPTTSETTRPAPRKVGLVRRLGYWLEPRWRDPGWLAFALNRLTGHILVLYLVLHFVVLSQLFYGSAGWDRLLDIFGSQPFLVGDTLLIAAVVFHGLNGLRVAALTFGFGTSHTTALIVTVLVASTVLTGLAGWAILFE